MNRIDIVDKVNQQQQLIEYWNTVQKTHNIAANRERRNVMFRHAFMVVAKELSNLSLAAVGSIVNKDHATVLHAIKQHPGNMKFIHMYSSIYKNMYMDISDLLVTDIDYFSQAGLKDENKELRERLMKLSRMNRELIMNKNRESHEIFAMRQEVADLKEMLHAEQIKNSKLNKKLAGIVW